MLTRLPGGPLRSCSPKTIHVPILARKYAYFCKKKSEFFVVGTYFFLQKFLGQQVLKTKVVELLSPTLGTPAA